MRSRAKQSGFTLIELLVVIAIIAILAAILFPTFLNAQRSARTTKCISNLRQIIMAVKAYNDNYNGRFMPAAGWAYGTDRGTQKSFHYVLVHNGYIKNDKVFYCPSAPSRPQDFRSCNQWVGQEENDPNAPDCGWLWNDGSTGSYGNNMALGGMSPVTFVWTFPIPTESNVPNQTKVIYITDARWVDLYGGDHPGRIGKARERHVNGAVCVCCDGHIKWITVEKANRWPQSPGDNPRWDYR